MKIMNNNTKGILYISLSALFFATYGVWSHIMGNSFGDFFQAWTRGIIIASILFCIGIATKQIKKIQRKDLIWFCIISLAGGLNQAPYFYAFRNINIGTATLLFYSSLTISSYILGKFFFREKITFIKLLSLFIALLGMFLIFSFSWQMPFIIPAFFAVIAGIMGGLEVVFSKKISNRYPSITVLIYIFVVMFVGNGIISFFAHDNMPSFALSTGWMAQIGYAASMLAAMYFVVLGFRYIEPSIGGILGLSEIIFTIIFGYIFFQQHLNSAVFIGGALILIAAALPNLAVLKPQAK